nr:hypothetical protein [uncultured Capnocytophaga sp.]
MNKITSFALLSIVTFFTACQNTDSKLSHTEINETAQIIAKLTDSIESLTAQRDEALNFSLETNELSQQYFEDLKVNNPSQIVLNALMELNVKDKNPYITAETNGKFLINKIRILNERWVICEFTDSEIWGDLLLEYHIDGNLSPSFKVLDEIIHPKN